MLSPFLVHWRYHSLANNHQSFSHISIQNFLRHSSINLPYISLTHWGQEKWPPFSRRHFQMHFLECKLLILIKISLKFAPKGPINNIPALVQIMAWRRPGDKPLSEERTESLLTHICVTRPQWVDIFPHIQWLPSHMQNFPRKYHYHNEA